MEDASFTYMQGYTAHRLEYGNAEEVDAFLKRILKPGIGVDVSTLPYFTEDYPVSIATISDPETGQLTDRLVVDPAILDRDLRQDSRTNALTALLSNRVIVASANTVRDRQAGISAMTGFVQILIRRKGAAANPAALFSEHGHNPLDALLVRTREEENGEVGDAWVGLWEILLRSFGAWWLMDSLTVRLFDDAAGGAIRTREVHRISFLMVAAMRDWMFEDESVAETILSYRPLDSDDMIRKEIASLSADMGVLENVTAAIALLERTPVLEVSERVEGLFASSVPASVVARRIAASRPRGREQWFATYSLNQFRLSFTARYHSPDAFLVRAENIAPRGGYVDGYILPNLAPTAGHAHEQSTPVLEMAANESLSPDEEADVVNFLRHMFADRAARPFVGGVDRGVVDTDMGAFQIYMRLFLWDIFRGDVPLFWGPKDLITAFLEYSTDPSLSVFLPRTDRSVHVWMLVTLLYDLPGDLRSHMVAAAPRLFSRPPTNPPDEVVHIIAWYQKVFRDETGEGPNVGRRIQELMSIRYMLVYGEARARKLRRIMDIGQHTAPAAARASA